MIELIEEVKSEHGSSPACIKVLGVGGAGGNTVNNIIQSGYDEIEYCVANTDAQALDMSEAHRIQIGVKSTKGLGTGANPEIGKRAAEEDIEKVMEALDGADIVFLTGGMGGGTGSGALPVIAQALHDKGVLTIAIVTKPFLFEGKRRLKVAEEAIEKLKQVVDTLLIMPNQKLLEVTDKKTSMIDAFALMNDVLSQSVRSISDIVRKPGRINVDFADVRAIMKDRGVAVMGTGCASGEYRATEAALQAISSPLLENMSVTGARGILFNITGGINLGLHEISEAASVIYQEAHPDANIILGSVIDENLTDEVIVTIIATGFDAPELPIKEEEIVVHAAPTQAPVDTLLYASLTEQAVRAAQELVEAIKVESVARAAQAAPQQEIHVYRPQARVTEEDSLHVLNASAKDSNSEGDEMHLDSIDLNDLDVPAFMRHDAQGEHKS